jgi:hypothetical protein
MQTGKVLTSTELIRQLDDALKRYETRLKHNAYLLVDSSKKLQPLHDKTREYWNANLKSRLSSFKASINPKLYANDNQHIKKIASVIQSIQDLNSANYAKHAIIALRNKIASETKNTTAELCKLRSSLIPNSSNLAKTTDEKAASMKSTARALELMHQIKDHVIEDRKATIKIINATELEADTLCKSLDATVQAVDNLMQETFDDHIRDVVDNIGSQINTELTDILHFLKIQNQSGCDRKHAKSTEELDTSSPEPTEEYVSRFLTQYQTRLLKEFITHYNNRHGPIKMQHYMNSLCARIHHLHCSVMNCPPLDEPTSRLKVFVGSKTAENKKSDAATTASPPMRLTLSIIQEE